MTEAERASAALHLRARVVLAIAFLTFAGIAPELNVMPMSDEKFAQKYRPLTASALG